GGRIFEVNRDLEITPTAIVKTDLSGYSFDISGVATYKATMWGGLSFRKSESVIVLLGYNLLENKELKVGYSFDYVAKDQDAKQPTSHEIFVRYNLPSFVLGGRKAVKTPRFSF
ncbi:MAG: type IX secretion system membrane protein PorP/SprF, partial [Cyclobacteriaceae bacterium]